MYFTKDNNLSALSADLNDLSGLKNPLHHLIQKVQKLFFHDIKICICVK